MSHYFSAAKGSVQTCLPSSAYIIIDTNLYRKDGTRSPTSENHSIVLLNTKQQKFTQDNYCWWFSSKHHFSSNCQMSNTIKNCLKRVSVQHIIKIFKKTSKFGYKIFRDFFSKQTIHMKCSIRSNIWSTVPLSWLLVQVLSYCLYFIKHWCVSVTKVDTL